MTFEKNNTPKIILLSFINGIAATGILLLLVTLFFPEDAEEFNRGKLVIFIVGFSIISYIAKHKQQKSSQFRSNNDT